MSGHAHRDCACARVRHEHGTEAAYTSDGCRCLPCRLARSRYCADWRAGRPLERRTYPICGVRRRLRALTTLGWSPTELAAVTGMHQQVLARLRSPETNSIRYGDDSTVLAATHRTVAAVYDQLWCTPSTGPKAARLRKLASSRGWLPPLAWDDDTIDNPAAIAEQAARRRQPGKLSPIVDEVAVERVLHGGRTDRLTLAEKTAAHARLEELGYSAREIAVRLGVTSRTVTRRRSAAA